VDVKEWLQVFIVFVMGFVAAAGFPWQNEFALAYRE